MIGPVERRLVTDFGELRSGMQVIACCDRCGRDHQVMLMELGDDLYGVESFFITPARPCWGNYDMMVGPTSVAKRLIFILVDPALEHPDVYADELEVEAVDAAERAQRQRTPRERAR